MRIKEIEVEGLFGIFNHVVPLHLDAHMTLIHGPNGFGKTILLSMINSLFNTDYNTLRRIPFKRFIIAFDDGCTLQIDKVSQLNLEGMPIHDEDAFINLRYIKNNELIGEHRLISIKLSTFPANIRAYLTQEISGLERIDSETWIYHPTGEQLSFEGVIYRFRNSIPLGLIKIDEEPHWLINIKQSIPVRFIETQRLFTFIDTRKKHRPGNRSYLIHSVINYSEELANEIKKILLNYGELSQSLDRTFPVRLIEEDVKKLNSDELRNKLGNLEEKRSKLRSVGLLGQDEEIDFKFKNKLDDNKADVLSIYVNDIVQKFSIFDEIASKIELMVDIINNKFLYKKISVSKEDGFVFSWKGQKISVSSLSSGEQHELVLLYEMLFKLPPNSLVLIDEPELSLHVFWQQQFLKDLKRITQLSSFDALIATHSPQIIHDRWDLAVELTGPNKC